MNDKKTEVTKVLCEGSEILINKLPQLKNLKAYPSPLKWVVLSALSLFFYIGQSWPPTHAHAEAEKRKKRPRPPAHKSSKRGNSANQRIDETEIFNFPGMTVDRIQRIVDLEATVCLNEGPLELIACSQGTKEHESIVTIKVEPRFVHLGLLMIGMKNGTPAMRQKIDTVKNGITWIDHPPSGDHISVSFVLNDSQGKQIERPITEFVTQSEETDEPSHQSMKHSHGLNHDLNNEHNHQPDNDLSDNAFPKTFLFAGSHIIQGEPQTKDQKQKSTPGQYLADQQGNVISISTFGDEVLCLPWSSLGAYSRDNSSLTWHANSNTLPKIGTKVTLRLRPHVAAKTSEKTNLGLTK